MAIDSSHRMNEAEVDDERSTRSQVRPPPDGGWGWVVVFASFMIHLVADGVTYTFGIFFVQFVHYFEEGYASTSFILSILVGTTLCCGPVASALTNRYGCRAVTIAGAIVATLGFIASLWAPNVTTLYFTIGLCVGIGFGLIYLPAIVSVTCYFERYRAFATGIAVCGSGLGTFLLAPLIEYLTVQQYGWKGAMLIVAGLCLNCAVFGSLFRSPDDVGRPARRTRSLRGNTSLIKIEVCSEKEAMKKYIDNDYADGDRTSWPPGAGAGGLRRSLTAHGHLAVEIDTDDDIDDDNNRIKSKRPMTQVWSTFNLAVSEDSRSGGSSSLISNAPTSRQPTETLLSKPLYRKDIFYGGSLLNIPQYRSNPSMYTASIIHIPTHIPPATSPLTVSSPNCKNSKAAKTTGCGFGSLIPRWRWWTTSALGGCVAREARDALAEMTDLSLLNDNVFLLFAISNFLTSIGFNVPYVYLKDRALLLGVSGESSSFLLAIIGVSNTISRVVLGYLSDKSWLNRLWLYGCSLTLCGLSTAMSSLCVDYPSLVLYATVFGATAGAYVGLTSVILVDLLGLEKLTNAFGLLLLFQGFASLIGPPIAGWLYDLLQSYDPGFYVAGATIILSGLMLFAIPWIKSTSIVDDDGSPQVTIESGLGSEDEDNGNDNDDDDDAELEDRPLEMCISRTSGTPDVLVR